MGLFVSFLIINLPFSGGEFFTFLIFHLQSSYHIPRREKKKTGILEFSKGFDEIVRVP